jgi:D-aminopeptidase
MTIPRIILVCCLSVLCLTASAQTTTTTPALLAYYQVKDALVATDAPLAQTQATALVSALGQVKVKKLSASGKSALASATKTATAIRQATDIDAQRAQFVVLSASMITLAKATKPANAYVQFCPMAADGKGASWLSDKAAIRNPYYGSKMLKCGSVKEEI